MKVCFLVFTIILGLMNLLSFLAQAGSTPPADILDLFAHRTFYSASDKIILEWTAPGDDGNTGTATSYDIRYSTSPINDGNWDSATQVSGEPTPSVAGTKETFTVTGLNSDTTYYFAIKTSDEVPNESGLSNLASNSTSLTVTATSGYPDDIQAAVNQVNAAGGGNVIIPPGDWQWGDDGGTELTVEVPGGVNIFSSGYSGVVGKEGKGTAIFNTVLRLPYVEHPNTAPYYLSTGHQMFRITSDGATPSRVSGISFVGFGGDSQIGDTGVAMYWVKDGRIDHCRFEGFGSAATAFWQEQNWQAPDPWLGCSGVVDHCEMINLFRWSTLRPDEGGTNIYGGTGWAYGVAIDKSNDAHALEHYRNSIVTNEMLAGQYTDETVFVEDSYFNYNRHAFVGFVGGIITFRYNLIENHADDYSGWMADQHPTRDYSGDHVWGGRWAEIYGNTWLDPPGDDGITKGFALYFGDAVIFDNVFVGMDDAVIGLGRISGDITWMYDEGRVQDTYLWNNTHNGVQMDDPTVGFNYNHNEADFGTHWFIEPRPNYEPYPYPHPLTLGYTTTTTTTISTTTTSTSTTVTTTISTTTTILPSQVSISGQLRNSSNFIEADVIIYNQVTSQVNTSDSTTDGNYSLGVWPDIYDLRFNIIDFFIPNFFIKLISLNIASNIQDVVNYVNRIENGISFIVDITGNQEIQVYSEEEPKTVKVNGTEMTRVYSIPSSANRWFYNSSEKRLYMIASLSLPTTTTTTTTSTTTTTIPGTTTTILTTTSTSTTSSTTTTIIPSAENTFGKTDIGSLQAGFGWSQKIASRFQAPGSGTITSLTARVENVAASSQTLYLAVYSDSAGAPNALLGYGTVVMGGGQTDWWNVTGLSIDITSGAYYWLTEQIGDAYVEGYIDAGLTDQFCEGTEGADSPPPNNLWNEKSYSANELSIFVTYIPT